MRCEVKNCKNNKRNERKINFFKFPSDPKLLKQWMKFCCNKNLNTKNARICMEHFKADDLANKMEYETGFATKLYLKPGATPTIREKCGEMNDRLKKREQRAQKRENKKIVEQLIREHDAASALLNEETGTLIHPKESDVLYEEECDIETFANSGDKNEIENLKNEIECLRKENSDLTEWYIKQISELEEKRLKERKIFAHKLKTLKISLNKSNFELKNCEEKLLDIFTKAQVAKLKAGIRRTKYYFVLSECQTLQTDV